MATPKTDTTHNLKVLFSFILMLILLTDVVVAVLSVLAAGITVFGLVVGFEFLPLGNVLIVAGVTLAGILPLSKVFNDSVKAYHPSSVRK